MTKRARKVRAEPKDDLVARGARELAGGDAEAAIQTLQQAAAADPNSARLQLVTGILAWRLSSLEQALNIVKVCHEQNPMNGTVAEVLASLLAQAGELVESLYFGKLATALGPAEGFVELLPDFFPSFGEAFFAIQEKPLLARAKLSARSGQLDLAINFARQHISLNPAEDDARRLLADCFMKIGEAGAALDALQPAATSPEAAPDLISRQAHALARIGERAEARRAHDRACAAAADDAEIAAVRIADAPWLGVGPDAAAAEAADWARRFCPARKAPSLPRADGKLTIGYLVSAFADPLDIAAIASVARAHDRSRSTIIGYGVGAQNWLENMPFNGAFDKWRDVASLDPATLARTLRNDALAVVIDCAGFAAPRQLQALARVNTVVRLSWLSLPPGLGTPCHDAVLGPGSGAVPSWSADKSYPLVRNWLKPVEHSAGGGARFGSDIGLWQLDEATVRLWSAVLAGVPGATLALRARDMKSGGNINRLVARFGRDMAARVDIVDAPTPEDFYRDIDLGVAPVRGSSPRMAAEAIACGIPVVGLAGNTVYEPYGAFLRGLGLSDSLVAADEQDYVSIAIGLAGSEASRVQVAAAVGRVAAVGEASARGIAEGIETSVLSALAEVVRS